MDLLARLTRPDWPARLERLRIEKVDRGPILEVMDRVVADPKALGRVQEMAEQLLLPHIGSGWRDTLGREGFDTAELLHPWMANALPLCALLGTLDDVLEHHGGRGIPEDISWDSLADLGQQVTKHRRVTGRVGLTHANWLRTCWAGAFLRLGRLQFELNHWELPEGERTVLNTHVPGEGPLKPEQVDEALLRAPQFFSQHYADQLTEPLEWIVCESWLLDQELPELLPGSNVADFAARWQPWTSKVKDRDAYYFVFDIEPLPGTELPFRLDQLPQDSSLQRALVRRWREGGHVNTTRGRIPVGSARA